MVSDWPAAVSSFQDFLASAGLSLMHREEQPTLSNKLGQYGGACIGVRVVADMGVWYVEVADIGGRPNEWYDGALLRDLLIGRGPDVLPIEEQVQLIEQCWPRIATLFDETQRATTHA